MTIHSVPLRVRDFKPATSADVEENQAFLLASLRETYRHYVACADRIKAIALDLKSGRESNTDTIRILRNDDLYPLIWRGAAQ